MYDGLECAAFVELAEGDYSLKRKASVDLFFNAVVWVEVTIGAW